MIYKWKLPVEGGNFQLYVIIVELSVTMANFDLQLQKIFKN